VAIELPEQRKIELVRPDLSAREAVVLILEHATPSIRCLPAFSVSIAGAADVLGRLVPAIGGWDVRFQVGDIQYVTAALYSNGNLVYRLEEMLVLPPPAFSLNSAWIDSTAAAEMMCREPLLAGMPEKYSTFLKMRMVEGVGLCWEVRRSGHEPGNGLHCSHSIGVNAANGDVAAETVDLRRAGVLIESRVRSRLDGCGKWIDRMATLSSDIP
jgi:hypothetical protein